MANVKWNLSDAAEVLYFTLEGNRDAYAELLHPDARHWHRDRYAAWARYQIEVIDKVLARARGEVSGE
jgi:hypothetical protein